MKPTKRGAICMALILALLLLAGYIEVNATSCSTTCDSFGNCYTNCTEQSCSTHCDSFGNCYTNCH